MSSPLQRVVDHVAYRRRRLRRHWRSVVLGGHDTSNALWITSWQRSGSTWLAEMLASPPRTRLVYEPANIPDDLFDGTEAALTPPPRDSLGHTSAVVNGLSGTVRHWWCDQFNNSHRPKRLVAKDVRGLGIAGSVAEALASFALRTTVGESVRPRFLARVAPALHLRAAAFCAAFCGTVWPTSVAVSAGYAPTPN